MNTMLWPGTWEYYLTNLVNGAVPDPADMIPAARAFFVAWVRARGPWPTLRIGRQPYGLLPVVWSGGYQPRAGDTLTAPLLALLEKLRPTWRSAAGTVPRVGLGTDPDATLAGILGMSARSETYVGRTVMGPQYSEYYWKFLAKPIDAIWFAKLGAAQHRRHRHARGRRQPDPARQLDVSRQALQHRRKPGGAGRSRRARRNDADAAADGDAAVVTGAAAVAPRASRRAASVCERRLCAARQHGERE